MLQNYITIALRVLSKSKIYTAINAGGLVVGITSFTLIMLFVSDEVSYDTANPNASTLYRVVNEAPENEPWLRGMPQMTVQMTSEIPEIERAARLLTVKGLVTVQQNSFEEEDVYFADPAFLKLFPHAITHGSFSFANDHAVIISAQAAARYFGSQDAVGKSIRFLQSRDTVARNYIVQAVLDTRQANSHLQFDFLMPYREGMAFEDNAGVYTYLQLQADASPNAVEQEFKELNAIHHEAWRTDATQTITLQPITSIHLDSHYAEELHANGNRQIVYILTAAAFLILLVALINYINISLARSTRRAKEVGIRKVLGAYRSQVLRQFLLESLTILTFSTIIAFAATQLLLPVFNTFTQKNIELHVQAYLPILTVVILLSGLMASAYPALLLSGIVPATILKDSTSLKFLQGTRLRNVLLTGQFSVAILLLIVTLTIWQQLNYVQTKNLGFEKDAVLVVHLKNTEAQQRYQVLAQKFSSHAEVKKVAAGSAVPGEAFPGWPYQLPAAVSPTRENMGLGTTTLFVDDQYLDLMNIRLVEGRNFDARNTAADSRFTLIVNEAFVNEYGWDMTGSPLGKIIQYHDPASRSFIDATVIGVVGDFHYQSFHSKIEPLIIRLKDPAEVSRFASSITTLSLKISGSNVTSLVSALERDWKAVEPVHPFDLEFLDSKIQRFYEDDARLGQLFIAFSGVSIMLTCLGLFGITLLMIEQRTKELGIRKILGATTFQLTALLSRRFIRLLLFAVILAIPAGYWAIDQWLQNFSYRIQISWILPLAAVLSVALITLLTVGYQSLKAARNNPVDALRNE